MAELEIAQTQLARRMDIASNSLALTLKRIREGLQIKPATVANLARGLECGIDDILEPLPSPASNGRATRPRAKAAAK